MASTRAAWNRRQSPSQEAVREEAFEEAKEAAKAAHWHAHEPLPSCLASIEALKREPNVAGAEGISGKSLGVMETLVAPSKAAAPAAPDVASMVEQLRQWGLALTIGAAVPRAQVGDLMIQAAALLVRLGQGWTLEPRELKLLIDYHDVKGCEAEAMGVTGSVRYHDKRRAYYESLLPPAPGASDE
jgi:hypothetical protein